MSSVLDRECQQMPAYVGVRTAHSAYDQRMSAYDQRTVCMATVKYVTQSSGIRQDVHIRYRYARHTLEVRYSTLSIR